MSNQQLAEELNKPIIRKIEKREVYSPLKDNIWCADLADTQLINKYNKGFRFLCVIDICSKHAWVVPLKDKKVLTLLVLVQKVFNESGHKPRKIWVYKGR